MLVEDGSTRTCRHLVDKYPTLSIQYLFKPNSGPGPSRNEGFAIAKGEYFSVFDSDCILPPDYLQIVDESLRNENWDAWGGPDKAHVDFTLLQKAMGLGDLGKFAQGVQNCVNHGISRCVPFWHAALTGAIVREIELPTFQFTIGKAESASGPTSQAICIDRFKTSGARFSRINTLIPIRPGLIPKNQYFQKDVSK